MQTNFMVDAIESTPETISILFKIKKYCCLKYDLNTFKNNVNTFEKIVYYLTCQYNL